MIVNVRSRDGICLGKTGEQLAVRVVFDAAGIYEEFGRDGTFVLLNLRAGDDAPYPVPIETADERVYWDVRSMDNAMPGRGSCELQYYVGDRIVKSETWETRVIDGIGDNPDAPEYWQGWQEMILEATIKAERVNTDVARNAEQAKESARDAKNAAETAEGIAQSAALDANFAKQASDNAQNRAERAEESARLAAGSAGAAERSAAAAQVVVDAYEAGMLKGDKGDKGDSGADGKDGYTPVKGIDYFTEEDKAEWEVELAPEVAAAKAEIVAQGAATLASIPADYTALDGRVRALNDDLETFKDGFGNTNLFGSAVLYCENAYVNYFDGHIAKALNNNYNGYIIPVDGMSVYTANNPIRFALPLAEDGYTATASALVQNITQINCADYPSTRYLAFSFNKASYPIDGFIISKGSTATDEFHLPKWTEKIHATSSFAELTGKLTADMVDGYAKGNLYPDAELYATNAYVNLYEGHLHKSNSANYNVYISKVKPDALYTFGNQVRFALPLAADKYTATASAVIGNIMQFNTADYPNTEYIAFSFDKTKYPVDTFIVSEGNIARQYDTLPDWVIDKSSKDVISKGVVTKSGALTASGNMVLGNARTNLRKGIRIVFECTVTSGTDFEIGFSTSETNIALAHNIFTITATGITYGEQTYTHGLNIAGNVQFLFEYMANGTAKVTLIANGNSFVQTMPFLMTLVAVPYIKSNGIIATDCKMSFICTDIRKKIWIFGDSYFAHAPERWTYYLHEYGYSDNVLIDGYPGMGSTNFTASLEKLLYMGKPQIAVDFVGMNDGTDDSDTVPNNAWLTRAQMFVELCEANGVEPMFATIPNVPSINHKGKNYWIKNSGYRYIDMCHAVGADTDVNWYSGMLSNDKIHPSVSGAKALFAQVLLDLPEVMIDKL